MRVSVDFDLCESNGVCESLAPQIFHLDDDDFLQVAEGDVPPDQEDDVQLAVRSCPRQAISTTP